MLSCYAHSLDCDCHPLTRSHSPQSLAIGRAFINKSHNTHNTDSPLSRSLETLLYYYHHHHHRRIYPRRRRRPTFNAKILPLKILLFSNKVNTRDNDDDKSERTCYRGSSTDRAPSSSNNYQSSECADGILLSQDDFRSIGNKTHSRIRKL